MFIIGKADEKEIKRMKELGFKVEDVNIKHFNQALDPSYDPSKDYDEYSEEYDEDKLVSVFIDCEILQQCELINENDK